MAHRRSHHLLLALLPLLASAQDAAAPAPGGGAAAADVGTPAPPGPPPGEAPQNPAVEAESEAPPEPPATPPVEELPPLPADMIVPQLSFSNPFNQYENGVIPGWQYGGEATLANDYISLTPSAPNKVGWVWSNEPVSFAAWEVQLEFHIGGQANRGAGGGMAFWFSSQQGRTGPIYGHEDTYDGLGIFFDTYEGDDSEETEPFVVAMMNYGSSIGGEGDSPNYYDNQVGVCFAAYRNLPHLVRARIVWADKKLQLWLDLDHSGHYQSCVQTKPDDSRLKLPSSGYFGVTASTGSFGDSHVVYSLTLANLEGAAAFEATPYHGADAQVPPEHLVHLEGKHHETHVKVAAHPAQLDAQLGAMAHAAEQVAHNTPVPPVQSGVEYMARFSAEMKGVEAALYELKQQILRERQQPPQPADGAATALSQQLREMEARLAAAPHAPAAPGGALEPALAAQLSSLSERLGQQGEAGAGCGSACSAACGSSLQALESDVKMAGHEATEKVAQSGRATEGALQRLESRVTTLEATLKLKTSTVEHAQAEASKAAAAMAAQLSSLVHLVGEVKEAQQRALTHGASSSSSGWLTPLLVCGQMLALAAFMFYRQVAKDKKRNIL